jgi:hypothetical protein
LKPEELDLIRQITLDFSTLRLIELSFTVASYWSGAAQKALG